MKDTVHYCQISERFSTARHVCHIPITPYLFLVCEFVGIVERGHVIILRRKCGCDKEVLPCLLLIRALKENRTLQETLQTLQETLQTLQETIQGHPLERRLRELLRTGTFARLGFSGGPTPAPNIAGAAGTLTRTPAP